MCLKYGLLTVKTNKKQIPNTNVPKTAMFKRKDQDTSPCKIRVRNAKNQKTVLKVVPAIVDFKEIAYMMEPPKNHQIIYFRFSQLVL